MDLKATLFSLIYFVYGAIQASAIDAVDPNALNAITKMKGWEINEYGGINSLHFNEQIEIPKIKSSNDVLIEVYTTSVNPLDQLMTDGYGKQVINTLRWVNSIREFPLILGREFSGVVKAKGTDVQKFNIGDRVFGVVPPHEAGSHAEYVVVDQSTLAHKPENIDDIEAAGIFYAGLTAWSSIFVSGQAGGPEGAKTSNGGGKGKRICILGASGGVGTLAVQIAKAEGMNITATCSTNAVEMVKNLGADYVIDYKKENLTEKFNGTEFDLILDAAGLGADYATTLPWEYELYVTLAPPLLNNTDSSGLIFGGLQSIFQLFKDNVQILYKRKGLVKWGIFEPAPQGIEYLRRLVDTGKMRPIIDTVYKFNETKEAFERVDKGHLRGKIIINVK